MRALLLLLLPVFAIAQDAEVPARAVNQAIDRGVAWLLAHQQLDGTWDYGNAARPGHTALCAYTLVKSGLSPEHHAVQRAMKVVQGFQPERTYDTALCILALAAHDPEGNEELIQELVDQLVDWQHDTGWGYPEGADLSNTQYAALGLWAGANAGARVTTRTWSDLISATLRYETKGGFGYRPDGGAPTGSMTAAGVAVLAICRDQLGLKDTNKDRRRWKKVQDPIEAGIRWLDDNWSVINNPGRGRSHLGYYLYGLERVGALAPTPVIGRHDWYKEGAAALVRGQGDKGHWGPMLGAGHEQTCFALLFLRRATMPVTGGLHTSGGKRFETTGVQDAQVHIAASGENPIGMWFNGIPGSLEDKLKWSDGGIRISRVIWRVDGIERMRLAGDEERASGHERFAYEYKFDRPGKHTLQAEVHALAPPQQDSRGRTYPATLRILHSPELEVHVENACEPWMLANAADRALNLMKESGARVTASSARRGFPAHNVLDGHQARSWVAEPGDESPTLTFQFETPPKVNTIVIGHAREHPVRAGRWARALEVEVYVNGERHRLRMHGDERRKGRLELPDSVRLLDLEVKMPIRAPGAKGEKSVGIAEVEIQYVR